VDEQAWLHHITLLNSGPKVIEPACGKGSVESMFMSGNERTVGGYGLVNSTIKSGYSITKNDNFILTTELMNMDDIEKWVWVTVTYELLEGPHPDYRQGKTVFMSIGQSSCDGLNVTNPFGAPNITAYQVPKSDMFEENSIPWRSPQNGYVLSTGGHMHDGGLTTEIFQNGKLICDSVAEYGKAKAKPGAPGHSHGGRKRQVEMNSASVANMAEAEHIQSQRVCDYNDGIPLSKGDSMHLKVKYNFNEHMG
jgi:hypothetical protein